MRTALPRRKRSTNRPQILRTIEPLEDRLLLAVFAQVNFQTAPPTPPVPAGYVPDSGLAYGDRGNGFTYGWWYAPLTGTPPTPSNPQPANNPSARNRLGGVSGQTPGLIYNTMVHFHKDGQSPGSNNEAVPVWWEIAVPNGLYHVRVVAGDSENHDSFYDLRAEAPKVNGIPDTTTAGVGVQMVSKDVRAIENAYPDTFADSGVIDVNVTDGNLTISEGPAHINGKIAFIQITDDAVTPTVPANPTNLTITSNSASRVALHWNDNSNDPNSETGFRIERSTDGTNFSLLGTVGKNTSDFVAAGLSPQTRYHFRVVAFNLVGDSAAPTNVVDTTTPAATGSIGRVFEVPAAGEVNLTAEGTLDWAHWGLTDANSFNHKNIPTRLISDVTLLEGSPRAQVNASSQLFTWSDGSPTATATSTPNSLGTFGFSHGFTFTVPADTTPRVLRVYVGVRNFRGQLTARLSDGSAADVVDSTLFSTPAADGAYTIPYRAGSAGQTLSVTWLVFPPDGDVTDANARIFLKAATLSIPPPPPTGVTNALAAQAAPSGRTVLTWTDQSTGENGYVVERAPDNAGAPGTFVEVGRPAGLRFYDRTAAAGGNKYHYRVRPMNFGGEGPNSNVAAVTTVGTEQVGTGARATYYDNPTAGPDAKNPVTGAAWPVTTVDPVINFNWGNNPPTGAGAGFGADQFMVRWTAKIKPDITGDYTFATDTDDGTRVIVNGVKVIDLLDRTGGLLGAPRNFGTPITLQAGQQYDLVFDMIEGAGGAGARLYWAHTDFPIELVPTVVMTPLAPDTTPPTITTLQVDTPLPATATYTPQQHLLLKFSETVGGFDADDIQIFDAVSGAFVAVGASHMTVAYDAASTTAVVTFHDVPGSGDFLPDGNYTILIPADTFSDAGGNPSAAEFRSNFYVYQGDTQLDAGGNPKADRKVDFVDYQRLAANFGKPNPSHGDGDFNHDGQVNNADFLILQSRFGTTLAPPPAPAATVSGAAPAPAPMQSAPRPVTKKPVVKAAPVAVPVMAPKFASKRIAGNRDLFN